MNSSDFALLSQNVSEGTNSNRNYASNPQRTVIKHLFQAKIKQSHDNLFNFINDNI